MKYHLFLADNFSKSILNWNVMSKYKSTISSVIAVLWNQEKKQVHVPIIDSYQLERFIPKMRIFLTGVMLILASMSGVESFTFSLGFPQMQRLGVSFLFTFYKIKYKDNNREYFSTRFLNLKSWNLWWLPEKDLQSLKMKHSGRLWMTLREWQETMTIDVTGKN